MSDLAQPFGPEEHQRVAKLLGVRRLDVLAQDPQSDPYYCGTSAQLRDADAFAALLEEIGLVGQTGLHLRRIHYRADALGMTRADIGTRYLNDKDSWAWLKRASKFARILGTVDPEIFIDKRNPDLVVHRWARDEEPEPDVFLVDAYGEEVEAPELARLPEIILTGAHPIAPPTCEIHGYDYAADDQPTLTEIWAEKSTMNDVLVPVARRLEVNFVPASGYQSLTSAILLLRRAERHDRPTRVLYVSDHDPAGQQMPVSVARDLQYWRDRLEITVPISVELIALTGEQVAKYDLPLSPVGGNTELDALEALHPGELARIVLEAASRYRDHDLPRDLEAVHQDAISTATSSWSEAIAAVIGERDELLIEVEEVTERYRERVKELARELNGELAPYLDRLEDLRRRAQERGEDFDPELPERPEPEPAEPPDDVLFNSRRHWLEQNDAYRNHRERGEGRPE